MKTSTRTLLLSAVLISLTSTVAYSASRAGAMTFTLGGGYDWFSSKRLIDNTGIPYGALGYDLTDRWGVEALLGFFTTKSKRTEDNGRQVRGTLFALDGLYHFNPYHNLEPYLLAGPGATDMNPNGNNAHAQGNVNAGVGMNYFFDKAVALRLEARDFYTIVGQYNDVYADMGVTFLLDVC